MTLIELLKQVLVSWQVLAVTAAIVIYFFIVSYAARSHRRSRPAKKPKVKKKKETPTESILGPETTESDANHVDDLGIEEA
jgi:flagellar biosynthesis/type III secretory pathway M-ring protein FliF/YscJ